MVAAPVIQTLHHVAAPLFNFPCFPISPPFSSLSFSCSPVCSPCRLAAMRGRHEICKLLVARGADVKAVTQFNETVLHMAAHTGSVPLVQFFLEAGVDPSVEQLCVDEQASKIPGSSANPLVLSFFLACFLPLSFSIFFGVCVCVFAQVSADSVRLCVRDIIICPAARPDRVSHQPRDHLPHALPAAQAGAAEGSLAERSQDHRCCLHLGGQLPAAAVQSSKNSHDCKRAPTALVRLPVNGPAGSPHWICAARRPHRRHGQHRRRRTPASDLVLACTIGTLHSTPATECSGNYQRSAAHTADAGPHAHRAHPRRDGPLGGAEKVAPSFAQERTR